MSLGFLNMGNAIPTVQRLAVKQRERFRCLRCGGRGAEWSHRRTRRIKDSHQHCTCNGCWLCSDCHRFITLNPAAGRDEGLIVSSFTAEPGTVPVRTFLGWVYLTCEATYLRTEST